MRRYTKSELNDMKRTALVAVAKENKIKNYSRMKKNQLIKAILDWQERLDESLAMAQSDKAVRKSEPKNLRKSMAEELSRQEEVHRDRVENEPTETQSTESKYDLGKIKEFPAQKRIHDLPDSYGDNKIVLMVRDPEWLFAYWEMTDAFVKQKQSEFALENKQVRYILRMLEYAGQNEEQVTGYLDFPLHGMTRKYYCQIANPGSWYKVEFGVLDESGNYHSFLRSNAVRSPRNSMSHVVDEQWMTIADEQSFAELYELSGGDVWKKRVGSEEMNMGRIDTTQAISSGVSSFVTSVQRNEESARHFYVKLRAQVKLFGETMPDARVKIGDRLIELNSDGTFELEFDFPDGTIKLPIQVISRDGQEEHNIETTFYHITRAEQKVSNKGGNQ